MRGALAAWAGGAMRDGMRAVVERIWRLEEEPAVGRLLAARGSSAANLCHHGEERAQG